MGPLDSADFPGTAPICGRIGSPVSLGTWAVSTGNWKLTCLYAWLCLHAARGSSFSGSLACAFSSSVLSGPPIPTRIAARLTTATAAGSNLPRAGAASAVARWPAMWPQRKYGEERESFSTHGSGLLAGEAPTGPSDAPSVFFISLIGSSAVEFTGHSSFDICSWILSHSDSLPRLQCPIVGLRGTQEKLLVHPSTFNAFLMSS